MLFSFFLPIYVNIKYCTHNLFPVKPWLQHCLQIKMATRESFNKLRKDSIKRLVEELGVDFHKKTKEEIVNFIFNLNVPLYLEGSPLDIPHFNQVQYTPLDSTLLPDLPFSAIVRFMVDRKINGRPVENFRGLDRASKHFEAGDVKDIQMAKVKSS